MISRSTYKNEIRPPHPSQILDIFIVIQKSAVLTALSPKIVPAACDHRNRFQSLVVKVPSVCEPPQ